MLYDIVSKKAPGLLRGLICFNIGSDELFDFCGRRCAIGLTGSTIRFQHIRLQVKREADVVLTQVFDLCLVLGFAHVSVLSLESSLQKQSDSSDKECQQTNAKGSVDTQLENVLFHIAWKEQNVV